MSVVIQLMFIVSVLFLLGHSTSVNAEVISEYQFETNKIYPVRAGLGITTQIELSPKEKVLDYSTGFSDGWDLVRRGNVFYLKPKNVDVDTNMLIRTEANSYMFELKVVATDWVTLEQAKLAGVQYKIVFRYPEEANFLKDAVPEAEKPTEVSTQLRSDRAYNFDYDYSTRTKQSWIIPTSVYDDGQFTYIKLNPKLDIPTGNFPVVYGRSEKRTEEFVVNTTVEDNTIIVHGIYPYLVIRHDKNVVGLRRNPLE